MQQKVCLYAYSYILQHPKQLIVLAFMAMFPPSIFLTLILCQFLYDHFTH